MVFNGVKGHLADVMREILFNGKMKRRVTNFFSSLSCLKIPRIYQERVERLLCVFDNRNVDFGHDIDAFRVQ